MPEGNEGIPSLGLPGATAFAGFQAALAAQRLLASQRLTATEAETPTIAEPGITEFVPTPPVTTAAPTEVRVEPQPPAPPPPQACPPPAAPRPAPCITLSQATVSLPCDAPSALKNEFENKMLGYTGILHGNPGVSGPIYDLCQDKDCPVKCEYECLHVLYYYPKQLAEFLVKKHEADQQGKQFSLSDDQIIALSKPLVDQLLKRKLYPSCLSALAEQEKGITNVVWTRIKGSISSFLVHSAGGESRLTTFNFSELMRTKPCIWKVTICEWFVTILPDPEAIEVLLPAIFPGIKEFRDERGRIEVTRNAALELVIRRHERGHVSLVRLANKILCTALEKLRFDSDALEQFTERRVAYTKAVGILQRTYDQNYERTLTRPVSKISLDEQELQKAAAIRLGKAMVSEAAEAGLLKPEEAKSLSGEFENLDAWETTCKTQQV